VSDRPDETAAPGGPAADAPGVTYVLVDRYTDADVARSAAKAHAAVARFEARAAAALVALAWVDGGVPARLCGGGASTLRTAPWSPPGPPRSSGKPPTPAPGSRRLRRRQSR
jgi:hypothetical protein